MKKNACIKKRITFLMLVAFIAGRAYAQPGPSQLADEITAKNAEYLSQVEQLSITVEALAFNITTRYEKRIRDGIPVLEPEEGEEGPGMYNGMMGEEFSKAVRNASSITTERVEGIAAYKIVIDDPEALHDLKDDGPELEQDMAEIKKVTLWLDRSELIMLATYFESVTDEGAEINMEMTMSDYQYHSGLPIAHTLDLRIEGLENEISEEDMEEARKGMAELEKQLSQMPEAQRKMIEKQMKPQLEKFQEMLGGDEGEVGNMTMRVTDVRVN